MQSCFLMKFLFLSLDSVLRCRRMLHAHSVNCNGPITQPICGEHVRMVRKQLDAVNQVQFHSRHLLRWNIHESKSSILLHLETFRNCADIAITSNTGGIPPLFVERSNPFLLYYRDYRAPEENNVFPLVVR